MYIYPNPTYLHSPSELITPLSFGEGLGVRLSPLSLGEGLGGEAFITPSLPPSQTSVHSPRRASSLLKYTP